MLKAQTYGRVAALCSLLMVMTCAGAHALGTVPPRFQPDLSIQALPGPFVGEDIYNTTGAGQQAPATVGPMQTQSYILHLQNDGWWWDTLRLLGPGSSSVLTVAYFDAPVGGNNITSLVTGSGYFTPSLAPTRLVTLRMDVTPTDAANGDIHRTLTLNASSVTQPAQKDVVQAVTEVGIVRQPDLLIKAVGGRYYGDGIFNSSAQGQTVSQYAAVSVPAVYIIPLENDGNVADQFVVKSRPSPFGWSVRFFNQAEGGTEITGPVTRAGWLTPPVARDGVRFIRLEVTPDSSTMPGDVARTLVEAKSFWSASKVDAVRALTTKALLYGAL